MHGEGGNISLLGFKVFLNWFLNIGFFSILYLLFLFLSFYLAVLILGSELLGRKAGVYKDFK